MAGGRLACVSLPLALTLATLIGLLISTLSGVFHSNINIFSVDLGDISIDPTTLDSIANDLGLDLDNKLRVRADGVKTSGITAADLGLDDKYEINLWGYCSFDNKGKRDCTKAQFDWAAKKLNTTKIEQMGSVAGVKVDLPKEVDEALKAFRAITKWTEVAFIVAIIAVTVELILGIFAVFSRGISCVTWLVACIAAVLVIASAGLSTGMALVVVGAVKSTAKKYGAKGEVSTQFMAIAWLTAAFAIGAALFWIFTICCCKRERSSKSYKHRSSDGEKLLPVNNSNYYPVRDVDHEHNNAFPTYHHGQNQNQYAHFDEPGYSHYSGGGYGNSQVQRPADVAYEPFSHRA